MACNLTQIEIIQGDSLTLQIKVPTESVTDSASLRVVIVNRGDEVLINKTFANFENDVFNVWLSPSETDVLSDGEYKIAFILEDLQTSPPLRKQEIVTLRVFKGIG